MGSTGLGIIRYKKNEENGSDAFGIKGAQPYKGAIDPKTGLEKVGANKITLKLKTRTDDSILFQFKLTKDNKEMSITGYKDGIPEIRCKVDVSAGHPSLDAVMKSGSKSEVANAIKMKDLFAKSTTVSENQLGSIAQKLLRRKKENG